MFSMQNSFLKEIIDLHVLAIFIDKKSGSSKTYRLRPENGKAWLITEDVSDTKTQTDTL